MQPMRQSKKKPSVRAPFRNAAIESPSNERLLLSSRMLVVSLLAIIFTAGCIGQVPAGTGGISIRALADPPDIRTDESTTLFVDVENRDSSQFIKVFVEAFDTGPFNAVRALSVPALQGSLPVPGTYPVEFGQTRFDVTINKSCTSTTQCFDEEYASCGVCEFRFGESQGTCQPSRRAKAPGEECTKHCECGQGSACRRTFEGISRCTPAGASACSDGTLLNTCKGERFCSPYGGDLLKACGGLDAIPSGAYVSAGGFVGTSDDCGCPFGTVCRGDGSCAVPDGCFTTIYGLKPGEIRTLECSLKLKNPASIIRDTTANIQMRTVFRKRLQVNEVLQFLSLDEFRRQEVTGSLQRKPQTFSASDQNLQLAVSYNKQPPFVEREKALMRLSISSVGSGTVYTLNPSDIVISQPGGKIKCSIETPLHSDRGSFTPITCEVDAGQVNIIENYPVTINIYYDYEVRQILPISIRKV